MEVRLNYKGNLYGFSRDQSGIGYWYGLKGSNPVPGHVGKFTAGITVSTVLASELTREAIRLKLADPRELSKILKKEEKSKRSRTVGLKKTERKNSLEGGFNPFQNILGNNPLEHEAEIKLEELKRKVKARQDQETTPFFSELFSPDDETTEEDESEEDVDLTFEEVEPEIIGE